MFTHTVHRVGDEVCVALAGEPEFGDRARLNHVLTRAMNPQPGTLQVDMGAVTFIDCAAIGTLIEVRNAALNGGVRFQAVNPKGLVLRVLLTLDLLAYLSAYPRTTMPFTGAPPVIG